MLAAASRTRNASSLRRSLATVADTPVKVAVSDAGQATSTVTVLLKAGSRYETAPGAAHVLKSFAFRSTSSRSQLRTIRESEIYGGVLSASLNREYLALTAEFLRGDENEFVDMLAGFLTSSTFAPHELQETVAPQVEAESLAAQHDPATHALDVAHSVAFRNGLGNPLYASTPVTIEQVKEFATAAFTKENVAVIGTGVSESSLANLLKAKLKSLPAGAKAQSSATKYYGGESRVNVPLGSPTIFVGFGTSTPSPALNVLEAHLDPTPSVKWSAGSSPLSAVPQGAKVTIVNEVYSDGALFGVLIQGADDSSIDAVKQASKTAVSALKEAANGLKGDALSKAVAKAKFRVASSLESGREASTAVLAPHLFSSGSYTVDTALKSIEGVDANAISKAAKALASAKPTFVAVGNVGILPYADEVGL